MSLIYEQVTKSASTHASIAEQINLILKSLQGTQTHHCTAASFVLEYFLRFISRHFHQAPKTAPPPLIYIIYIQICPLNSSLILDIRLQNVLSFLYVKDMLRLLKSVHNNNNEHVQIFDAVFFSHLGCCPKITQPHFESES